MTELDQARTEIQQIDREMARLFERRMKTSQTIAAYKKERGLAVRDPTREAEWLEQCRKHIEDEDVEAYYLLFQRNVVDLSCQYQARLFNGLRVAYCGVEGAYAYEAAKKMFPEPTLIPCASFVDAYRAVEKGTYDCAVLPLENSYAGEVGTVMDLLFSGELYVNQVFDLPIVHCLLAPQNASLETIRTVVSHPQALQQCDKYLHTRGFKTEQRSNTAVAARDVAMRADPTVAAIASEETAKLNGLKILEKGINDSSNNTTRFAALSRVQSRRSSAKTREDANFILVFTLPNKSGSLAQALNIIGAHGYNMRSLRSRPMKELQWNYFFYVEAEGNVNNENGQNMLRELSAICARLKLVGTYYSGGKK